MVILFKTHSPPTEEMSQGRLGRTPKLWINNTGYGFGGEMKAMALGWSGLGRPPKGEEPEQALKSHHSAGLRAGHPTFGLCLDAGRKRWHPHPPDEASQVHRHQVPGHAGTRGRASTS